MWKWIIWLGGAVVIVSLIGRRWEALWNFIFGGVSPLWRYVVIDLQWLDKKAIELGFFPIGIAIGLLLIVGGAYGPKIWEHLRRYLITKREFEKAFAEFEHPRMRQTFRWKMEKVYLRFHKNSKHGDFAEALKKVQFPNNFPPRGNLSSYADNFKPLDDGDSQLWEFATKVFDEIMWGDKPYLASKEEGVELIESRRVNSKFWDDWARAICEGRLRCSDIDDPLRSNIKDVKLLALSELALARKVRWDEGKGKTALFLLAKHGFELSPTHWKKFQADLKEWRAGNT